MKEHTTPEALEKYSFQWMIVCLVLTALSLFFGATPIATQIFGYSNNLVGTLLNLSWLISGVASAFLLYFWNQKGQKLFGESDKKHKFLFLLMIVIGLNIGLIILIGNNILMSIFWNLGIANILFKIFALISAYTAFTLFNAWKANAEQLFDRKIALNSQTEEVNNF